MEAARTCWAASSCRCGKHCVTPNPMWHLLVAAKPAPEGESCSVRQSAGVDEAAKLGVEEAVGHEAVVAEGVGRGAVKGGRGTAGFRHQDEPRGHVPGP